MLLSVLYFSLMVSCEPRSPSFLAAFLIVYLIASYFIAGRFMGLFSCVFLDVSCYFGALAMSVDGGWASGAIWVLLSLWKISYVLLSSVGDLLRSSGSVIFSVDSSWDPWLSQSLEGPRESGGGALRAFVAEALQCKLDSKLLDRHWFPSCF